MQTSDNNIVGQVLQEGAAGAAETQNSLNVEQRTGTANTITVNQQGNRNLIGSTTAETGALMQNGSGNQISVSQVGSGNGSDGAVAGIFDTGVFDEPGTSASLMKQATVRQNGERNVVDYSPNGNAKLFAVAQSGINNDSRMTVTGNANEAALSQIGDNNLSNHSQTGDRNDRIKHR